jgi:hypothetical protein
MDNKKEKLLGRPVESDTRILFKEMVKVGEWDALYERWSWEGITASSVVFLYEDVHNLGKEKIIEIVRSTFQLSNDEKMTYSVNVDHVFVNFAFEIS